VKHRFRQAVEKCLRSALPPETELPPDDEDWIDGGLLDSMGLVEVLVCIEQAVGAPGWFEETATSAPRSIRAVLEAMEKGRGKLEGTPAEGATGRVLSRESGRGVEICGWSAALGSDRISANQIEREFSLPPGALSKRAGIESVRRASAGENEVSLARAAAEQALRIADVSAHQLDWIIATTETYLALPSLGASLHTALLAPGGCRVLDVGGACVGLVNSLGVAEALFADERVSFILVVSGDVHSRLLVPGKVPGEFGGLFGDGAAAFVLQSTGRARNAPAYRIQASIGGCAGTFSAALQVQPVIDGSIGLVFDGEALAHAAVDRLERIIGDLETITGIGREKASAFAIHQPNPRLVDVLVRQANLDPEKVPRVGHSSGNLGSSTCGVALSMALDRHAKGARRERGPIFVAAVGPGLLWAGLLLQ
ncbi:MAG: 3-oxoacyl-ACP synthase III family protein, partial [bacterium]